MWQKLTPTIDNNETPDCKSAPVSTVTPSATGRVAMLTFEKTLEYLKLAKAGNEDAKTKLVTHNAPLVKSIVKRYLGRGVDYDDLYQLGCMGLVKAINKYDLSYSVRFTTYAVPLIAGEIKRFLRDDGQIKVSRSVKSLYTQIKRLLALHQGEETAPSVEFLAGELNVTKEDVIFAMEASHLPLDLFDKGDNDGLCIADKIADNDGADVVDNIVLHNLLNDLEEKERKVILLRYFRNATQSEIAKQLNISQVQVSRIEQRVLERFREFFKKDEIDEWNC